MCVSIRNLCPDQLQNNKYNSVISKYEVKEQSVFNKLFFKPDMVVDTLNPSTWEAEAGGAL